MSDTQVQVQKPGQPEKRHMELRDAVAWILVVAWAIFIFFMSARTESDLGEGGSIISQIYQMLHQWQDNILGTDIDILSPFAHFCEYAIFGALLSNALAAPLLQISRGRSSRSPDQIWKLELATFVTALGIAAVYGATDEIHQIFVDGRYADFLDWLVDCAGSALGAGLVTLIIGHFIGQKAQSQKR